MKRNPLWVRHKQEWGQGFILLLPQAAAFFGSDAGSNNFKPLRHSKPSDVLFHVVPDVWGTLLGCGLRFAQWRRTRNLVKERDSHYAWRNGIINTIPEAININLGYSEKAHSNKPSTGYGYESRALRCILTALSASSIIHLLKNEYAKSGKVA